MKKNDCLLRRRFSGIALIGILAVMLLPMWSMAHNGSAAQKGRPEPTAAPINWRVNVKMLSATEGEAIFIATIDDGWHLYGTQMPKNGPKATEIDFAGSKGVKFTSDLTASSTPIKYRDAMFGLDLTCWEGRVTFRRKFRVTEASGAVVAGTIHFMGCNDVTCLPPSAKKFSKPVVIRK